MEILRGVRKRLELPADDRGPEEVEVAAGVHGLSNIELTALLDLAVQRYQTKRMDPGRPPFPLLPLLHPQQIAALMSTLAVQRCCAMHHNTLLTTVTAFHSCAAQSDGPRPITFLSACCCFCCYDSVIVTAVQRSPIADNKLLMITVAAAYGCAAL